MKNKIFKKICLSALIAFALLFLGNIKPAWAVVTPIPEWSPTTVDYSGGITRQINHGIATNTNEDIYVNGMMDDGGGGTGATATAVITGGSVDPLLTAVTKGGTGYTSPPDVSFLFGCGGTGATATAGTSGGSVVSLNLISGGTGYTCAPFISFTGQKILTIKYDTDGVEQGVHPSFIDTCVADGYCDGFGAQVLVDSNNNSVYSVGIDGKIIKYDLDGNFIKAQPNAVGNYFDNATLDDDGNIYIVGTDYDTSLGYYYILVIKYDNDLTPVPADGIQYAYGNEAGDIAGYSGKNNKGYGVAVDSSENVYVTGYAIKNTNDRDFITAKFNAGVKIWTKTYDTGSLTDFGNTIAVESAFDTGVPDSNKNVYILGSNINPEWMDTQPYTDNPTLNNTGSSIDSKVYILKYTNNGSYANSIAINKSVKGTDSLNGQDIADVMTIGRDNNLYIAGAANRNTHTLSTGEVNYDAYVAKYDGNLNKIWDSDFYDSSTLTPPNKDKDDIGYAIAVDSNDKVVSAMNSGGVISTIKYLQNTEPKVKNLNTNASGINYCFKSPDDILLKWQFEDIDDLDIQTAYRLKITRALDGESYDSGKVTDAFTWIYAGDINNQSKCSSPGFSSSCSGFIDYGVNYNYTWTVEVWDSVDASYGPKPGTVFSTPKHRYPEVGFTPLIPFNIVSGVPVSFDTASTICYDTGGAADCKNWTWSFGDGTPDKSIDFAPLAVPPVTNGNTNHLYTNPPATLTVKLTAEDDDTYNCFLTKSYGNKKAKWKEVIPVNQ